MPANPYRGLECFGVEDAALYFGRERAARELLGRLGGHRVVAVVGVKGAGKSSLVRAGLARALRESGDPRALRVVVPGEPLPMPGARGLVLVVDQFERLLGGTAGPAAEIDRLLSLAGRHVSVVVALDADAFGRALAHPGLAGAMEPYTLPPMTGRELLRAIEEPARRSGCAFEPGLAERIAGSVRGPGDLPRLGAALHALWERDAASGMLTAATYDALGAVPGAARAEPAPDTGEPPGPARTWRPRRRIAALAAAAALVAVAAATVALVRGPGAHAQADSRAIAAAALPALDRRFDTGLLLSLEAWRTADTVEARDAALAALQRTEGMRALLRNRSRAEITAVALGGTVLAAADATAVTLFDVSQRRRLGERIVSPDGTEPLAVAVSRDGGSVAAAFGGDVVLRDGQSTLRIDDARVTALAFSPDGRLLAGAGARQLRVWDRAGRALLEASLPRARAGVAADVAFDPGGRTLTELRGGRVTVWAVDRWRRRSTARLPGALAAAAELSPDGRQVAGGDRGLWLWRIGSPRARRLAGRAALAPSAAAAVSPDARRLAVPARDGTIAIWDAESGRRLGRPLSGGRDALSVAWQRAALVSGGRSGLITVWAPGRRDELAVRDARSGGEQVSFGRTGALAWSDGSHLTLRARLGTRALERGANAHAIEFSADGSTIVGAERTRVRIFDLGLQERATHIPNHPITGIATGPHELVAYGDSAGQVHVWPAGTFGELRSSRRLWSTTGWLQPVGAVAFAPDGHVVAGAIGTTIRLFAVAPARLRDGPVLRGHDGPVTGVAFSPDGRMVASSAEDATVRLWSPRTGSAIGAPLWADGKLAAIAFSPDGRTLAGARVEGGVRLWDVATRRPVGPPFPADAPAADLAFAPDGSALVSTARDSLTRWSRLLWARRPRELAPRLCAIAGRELTREEWAAYVPAGDWRPTCRTG